MSEEERKLPNPLAPGIYFGLPEDRYHIDPALGSSDIRKLAVCPPNWWWESRFNPDPDDEEGEKEEAKIVGTAMHKNILEGRELFEKLYAPAMLPGNIKEGKAERKAIEEAGKTPIRWRFYKRIMKAGSLVRSNPEHGDAFHNTIGTEVSIFWIDPKNGIRKKVRFDALKPIAGVDLKSITNRDGIDFVELCRRHIGTYKYFVQAAYYMDGWRQMAALVEAGKVFGLPDGDTTTVDRLRAAAAKDAAAFVFVFVQKQSAPLSWATQISPENGIFDHGRAVIEQGEANWLAFSEKFGLDTPWVEALPLEELDINDIPAWAFRK